jgi:uncharacterized protein YndB with AHSA1/START domain
MADRTESTDHVIDHEVVIEAPAEVVWRTITEPDQISLWFADQVTLDLRPGGHGTFVFDQGGGPGSGTAPLVVEVVDPPRRFAFRWAHPSGEVPGPGNSVLVDMTLSAEGDERTRLRVTETGVADLPWPDDGKAGYVDEHNQGWAFHLGRLVDALADPAG